MIGSLLSAGASLLGGFLNRDAQKDANAANAAQAERNIALQREFAQNSIQWRAADAEKAGVHPIYALGSPGMSFSPVSVGNTATTGVGSSLQSMGQDISRSVAAYRSPGEKVNAVQAAQTTASNALDLETKQLNNTLLRAKIAAMGPGTPPGLPFEVPEKSKPDENPPLMGAGKRWLTDSKWSPMKAFEDRYGDEGPASWIIPPFIAAADAIHNLKNSNKEYMAKPGNVARWDAQDKAWQYFTGGSVSPRRARPRGDY